MALLFSSQNLLPHILTLIAYTVNLFNGIVMKSTSLQLPTRSFVAIFALLASLMLITRTHHFATFNQLPSASIAIFFLAGMYLRHIKSFWFFYILSICIDLSSSYFRGQLGDCLTASYPALAFSYATMFAAGCYTRPNWTQQVLIVNLIKVAAALFIASSIAFFISNSSYYALSGKFLELSWAEYGARVDKYYFRSISNPVFYVLSAMVMDWVISRYFRANTAVNSAYRETL